MFKVLIEYNIIEYKEIKKVRTDQVGSGASDPVFVGSEFGPRFFR